MSSKVSLLAQGKTFDRDDLPVVMVTQGMAGKEYLPSRSRAQFPYDQLFIICLFY
jgi:hypothetical protein